MQCAGERGRMLLECARPRRGLPHSKTLARESKPLDLAKLLDCASPLALWIWAGSRRDWSVGLMLAPGSAFESGRRLPHSKTPPRESQPLDLAKLLDCASPLALWIRAG